MNTNKPTEILEGILDPTLREIYRIANNACNQGISSVYERAAHEICQMIRSIPVGGSEYHGQYHLPKLPEGHEDLVEFLSPEAWRKWKRDTEEIVRKMTQTFKFNHFSFKENPHTISITDVAHQNGGTLFMVPGHLKIVSCSGTFKGDSASIKLQSFDLRQNIYKDLIGTLIVPGYRPLKVKVKDVILQPETDPASYHLIFLEED